MDQVVSGSDLYPLRLLEDGWFTRQEIAMIGKLEQILQGTGHARDLTRDMLTPLVYDIEVMIVLDSSRFMASSMLGRDNFSVEQVLQTVLPAPLGKMLLLAVGAPSPSGSRMSFALDAL